MHVHGARKKKVHGCMAVGWEDVGSENVGVENVGMEPWMEAGRKDPLPTGMTDEQRREHKQKPREPTLSVRAGRRAQAQVPAGAQAAPRRLATASGLYKGRPGKTTKTRNHRLQTRETPVLAGRPCKLTDADLAPSQRCHYPHQGLSPSPRCGNHPLIPSSKV